MKTDISMNTEHSQGKDLITKPLFIICCLGGVEGHLIAECDPTYVQVMCDWL
jgi:hypothetical protein